MQQFQIKSSLYSPHYAEACNELRGPSPRLSAWATQLRRSVATVASRWRHMQQFLCYNFTKQVCLLVGKMESRKAKRSPKWTAAQLDALLTTIEAHREHTYKIFFS